MTKRRNPVRRQAPEVLKTRTELPDALSVIGRMFAAATEMTIRAQAVQANAQETIQHVTLLKEKLDRQMEMAGRKASCVKPGPGGITHGPSLDGVARLRVAFIKQAVLKVKEVAARSEADARVAADELRRYFQWIEQDLPPEDREPLLAEIQELLRQDHSGS